MAASALLGCLIIGWSCTSQAAQDAPVAGPSSASTDRSVLEPIPEPDLSRLEPAVQNRIRGARADLAALRADDGIDQTALAEAYGELGRLHHAHHLHDSAAACYRNASVLAPSVFRWHYLLGVVYQETNRLEAAAATLQQAQQIRPSDARTRLHLAQVYRQLNQAAQAGPLLEPLLAQPDLAAAASYELGQLALARRDYAQAVRHLERALEAQPKATRLHFPLAMAYRGLGQVDRARLHLAKQGDGEVVTPDPLVDSFARLTTGARAHIERALEAVQRGQFDVAGAEFAQAVTLNPGDVDTRVRWARSLYLTGAHGEARAQLQEALNRDPNHAPAHLFAGALAEEDGRDNIAIDHYRRCLASDPGMTVAEFFLGNALMRQNQPAEAAAHYRRVVERAPHNSDARVMEALALLRSDARHRDVRARLEDAAAAFPEDPRISHVLARLLAASPDAAVRDGERALPIAQYLYGEFHDTENALLLAMAYAEVGRYDHAAAIQREAIAATEFLRGPEAAAPLQENLRKYENAKPCRVPWRGDEAMFYPPPIGSAGVRS